MALSLLLVEDNERTRTQILSILQKSEFQITVAIDGLDALNQARMGSFDVVLLDHKMPLMDGLTLLKNLRDEPLYANTPLLLMTTAEPKQISKKAERLGANVVLGKPLDAEFLLTKLRHFALDRVVA